MDIDPGPHPSTDLHQIEQRLLRVEDLLRASNHRQSIIERAVLDQAVQVHRLARLMDKIVDWALHHRDSSAEWQDRYTALLHETIRRVVDVEGALEIPGAENHGDANETGSWSGPRLVKITQDREDDDD